MPLFIRTDEKPEEEKHKYSGTYGPMSIEERLFIVLRDARSKITTRQMMWRIGQLPGLNEDYETSNVGVGTYISQLRRKGHVIKRDWDKHQRQYVYWLANNGHIKE